MLELLEPEARKEELGLDRSIQYSIAISLKRIADALNTTDQYGMTGSASIAQAIYDGLRYVANDVKVR